MIHLANFTNFGDASSLPGAKWNLITNIFRSNFLKQNGCKHDLL